MYLAEKIKSKYVFPDFMFSCSCARSNRGKARNRTDKNSFLFLVTQQILIFEIDTIQIANCMPIIKRAKTVFPERLDGIFVCPVVTFVLPLKYFFCKNINRHLKLYSNRLNLSFGYRTEKLNQLKMKTKIIFVSVLAAAGFSIILLGKPNLTDNKNSLADSFYCKVTDFPKQEVSAEESKELIYMREEEKMAYDFYSLMFEKWGLRPFGNIKEAEARHMQAVKTLLDRYGISDPVSTSDYGVFSSEKIKSLYDNFLKQGNLSAKDALLAAAELEEVDIIDLKKGIKESDNDDIRFVYNNLVRGSENHLRAFVRNLSKYNTEYSPKRLDKETYNDILGL